MADSALRCVRWLATCFAVTTDEPRSPQDEAGQPGFTWSQVVWDVRTHERHAAFLNEVMVVKKVG